MGAPYIYICIYMYIYIYDISHLSVKDEAQTALFKDQSVPRCKHFLSRLQKPICLCCKWHKSLFVLR